MKLNKIDKRIILDKDKLRFNMLKKGININDLAGILNRTRQSVSYKIRDGFRVEEVMILCEFFQCAKEDLI